MSAISSWWSTCILCLFSILFAGCQNGGKPQNATVQEKEDSPSVEFLSSVKNSEMDWGTLVLTPEELNAALVNRESSENKYLKNINPIIARAGSRQVLDCSNGGWLNYQPDYFSESEQEVSVEAWIYLEKAQQMGCLIDRPGMYTLESVPGSDDGADLLWSVRVGGEWKSVSLPLPVAKWVPVTASFDGHALSLTVEGETAMKSVTGLMARNTEGLWIGAGKNGDDTYPGSIAQARVSRIVRNPGAFMKSDPLPSVGIDKKSVTPMRYDREVDITRPDGIVDRDRKHIAAPTLVVPTLPAAPVVDGDDSDSCWQSVAPARSMAITSGYQPPKRRITNHKIEARLVQSGDRLFGLIRLIAPGGQGFTIGGDDRDEWAALKDCAEVFISPAEDGFPYYQFCFGLGGGVYDGKGKSSEWNAPNLKSAVMVDGDMATVEFSVPFSDFEGAAPPNPGDLWRGNFFASLKGEQTTWAFFWPLPHVPFHFGNLVFSGEPPMERSATPCSVRGRLVDEHGEPVVWRMEGCVGAVGINGNLVRTDDQGYFEINGVEPGKNVLRSYMPKREIVAYEMELKPGMNDLGGITLGPRRSRRPAWRVPASIAGSGSSVAWFRSWLCSPPDMEKAPRAEQWANPSPETVIARGETEDVAAAFVALKDLPQPSAKMERLTGPDGAIIPARNLQIRWVTRQIVVPGYARPPEYAGYAWKHLRNQAPDRLKAGDIALLAISVEVPQNAHPGDYSGSLQLLADGETVSTLPVAVTVAPFELAESDKKVGMYVYSRQEVGNRFYPVKPRVQMDVEMRDMRAHGCEFAVLATAPICHEPENAQSLLELCEAAGAAGLTRVAANFTPFTDHYWWNPAMMAEHLAKPGLKAKCLAFEAEWERIEKTYPQMEIIATYSDEVTKNNALLRAFCLQHRFYRGLETGRRTFITAMPQHLHQMQALNDPPEVINWGIGAADKSYTKTAAELDAWAEKVKKAGFKENWCYNNGVPFWETPGSRLASGYWLWASPFDAQVPWIYYYYDKDPFNPFDGKATDLGFAHPVNENGQWRMIPAIQWKSWRDGYDDLRWVATLEEALKRARAKPGGEQAEEAAQKLLDEFSRYQPSVQVMGESFDPDEFMKRRGRILQAVAALHQSFNSH